MASGLAVAHYLRSGQEIDGDGSLRLSAPVTVEAVPTRKVREARRGGVSHYALAAGGQRVGHGRTLARVLRHARLALIPVPGTCDDFCRSLSHTHYARVYKNEYDCYIYIQCVYLPQSTTPDLHRPARRCAVLLPAAARRRPPPPAVVRARAPAPPPPPLDRGDAPRVVYMCRARRV